MPQKKKKDCRPLYNSRKQSICNRVGHETADPPLLKKQGGASEKCMQFFPYMAD